MQDKNKFNDITSQVPYNLSKGSWPTIVKTIEYKKYFGSESEFHVFL